ncbi:MAG: hypothetical protein ACRD0O_10210 [Acidimicrobiia bacterium]
MAALVIPVAGVGVVPRAIRLAHERRYCTSTWRAGQEARWQMIEFNQRAEAAGASARTRNISGILSGRAPVTALNGHTYSLCCKGAGAD